tara:strand:- start:19406 stop:19510 length:105 start_codon:yes stop_codon:yes gene_type:complete
MISFIKRLSSSRKQDLMVCLLGIGLVFVAIAING